MIGAADARAVLTCYPPPLAGAVPVAVPAGFGGALLWRVGQHCLRAWPPDYPPARLSATHRWLRLAVATGLAFVPALVPTRSGVTAVSHLGRQWEVTSWLPGQPDFRDTPSAGRLRSACLSLARLHAAWAASPDSAAGPPPAIERRLRAATDWLRLAGAGWRPKFAAEEEVTPWAARAWHSISGRVERVAIRLAPWSRQQVRLSPCHGDPWHDNLLFSGDELTGLVDYGAARVDDPAADLARLLGSLAGNDRQAWAEGMAAYAAVRPLPADAGPYLAALDETGVVLAAANWLRWLYHEGRPVTDQPATVRRLAELVRRLEARGDVRGRPDFFS